MTAIVTAFFNNKAGAGKTSLVYHLAWMYARLGVRVLAVDLDPQADLTARFLDELTLERFWPDGDHPMTVYGAFQTLIEGTGDVDEPHVEEVDDNLALLVGDMCLSGFEDLLSQEWFKALDGDPGSYRVLSAFWRMIQLATSRRGADLALMDLGSNLGAINRAALISADCVVVPLGTDLFSLQGLRNLGPALNAWREEWGSRSARPPRGIDQLPPGRMEPVGYVVLRHSERLDRPFKPYGRWMSSIPNEYRSKVKGEAGDPQVTLGNDPNCIAVLKHYRTLIPMAQEAGKPIFDLRPGDGALGAHMSAAQDAYSSFEKLARGIAERIGVTELLQPTRFHSLPSATGGEDAPGQAGNAGGSLAPTDN